MDRMTKYDIHDGILDKICMKAVENIYMKA